MLVKPNLIPVDFVVPNGYEVGSDVWWVSRLLAQRSVKPNKPRKIIGDSRRYEFSKEDWYDYLHSYRTGEIPLTHISEKYAEATREFLRLSKVQFPATIVDSLLDRVQPIGARVIGSSADSDGDDNVRHFIQYNGSFLQDAEDYSLTYGMGYVLVGSGWDGKSDDTDTAIATGEDPRTFSASLDPFHPGEVRAALKFFFDPDMGRQVAAVYVRDLPDGTQHEHMTVWYRDSDNPVRGFDPDVWELDEDNSQDLIQGIGLPIVAFPNRRGIGEFEEHLDLIDRIINGISDRLWAAKYQIFKQRAVLGDLPDVNPETGEVIDYNALFTSDPAGVWRAPTGTSIWESSQLNIQELITPYVQDVKELAMASRTAFPIIASDSENQSASGVDLYTDGIGFKAEDRQKRWGPQVSKLCRLGLLYSGFDDPGDLEPMWAPVDRDSILNKGQAAAQIYSTGAPAEGIWADILDLPPATVQRWRMLAAKEQLLDTRSQPSNEPDKSDEQDKSDDEDKSNGDGQENDYSSSQGVNDDGSEEDSGSKD